MRTLCFQLLSSTLVPISSQSLIWLGRVSWNGASCASQMPSQESPKRPIHFDETRCHGVVGLWWASWSRVTVRRFPATSVLLPVPGSVMMSGPRSARRV
ncbi:Uncharacterised protein [Mycobacteroides abscessus subsp. abscessus]|nr:Uncharacterised protein [Mycobacteroides abscessus subsp. abscessus]